jgi:hypothetical protein
MQTLLQYLSKQLLQSPFFPLLALKAHFPSVLARVTALLLLADTFRFIASHIPLIQTAVEANLIYSTIYQVISLWPS